ncbi:MAG: hypothetical protein J7K20_03515, partial [Thermodesulfobacterium sp.]|nr:hypothetical protein [Thermodesulfobacterium sp.]
MKKITINGRTESESNNMDKIKSLSNFEMITTFGVGSDHYKWTINQLRKIYFKLKEKNPLYLPHLTKKWITTFLNIYGDQLSTDIFLNHVYLAIIIKTALFLKFSQEYSEGNDIINSDTFNADVEDNEIVSSLT